MDSLTITLKVANSKYDEFMVYASTHKGTVIKESKLPFRPYNISLGFAEEKDLKAFYMALNGTFGTSVKVTA